MSSFRFSNIRPMMVLYSSFVCSVLEYGSRVWSPYYITHINRLEKVQRKFVKRICFKFYAAHFFICACFKFCQMLLTVLTFVIY
jgi:hypothetical protein